MLGINSIYISLVNFIWPNSINFNILLVQQNYKESLNVIKVPKVRSLDINIFSSVSCFQIQEVFTVTKIRDCSYS